MSEKSTKHIAEQKLRAFSIGAMGKRTLTKKEIEEMKKKEEDAAAAQAFQEFVDTFTSEPASKASKVWIKAGTYDAGKRQEDTKDKGKLYKPQSKLIPNDIAAAAEKAKEMAKMLADKRPEKPNKKKSGEKKKSNLELFKEELKMIQEEREERHKYKNAIKTEAEPVSVSAAAVDTSPVLVQKSSVVFPDEMGSLDCGDPNTTNIYLGNINPKLTEHELMELFGRYGPLASIKIMYPRTDEEKARGKNCGFVAFMSRKDGERAMRALNGKEIMHYEMRLGWGKIVPIPHHPIYVPPSFIQLTMPPPPSGLPFNAQPGRMDKQKVQKMVQDNEELPQDEFDRILFNATVKVVIPTDRQVLGLIHRMIEFVIREGPMFEAMIMNREINNPTYRFLFENQSPAHIYYRWKLFSLLQGDTQTKWSMNEFRMFKGGSIWKPPPMNQYTQGMPDELVEELPDLEPRKGSLSNAQRERMEDLLRHITPEKLKVAEAMVFCIEHAEAAEEISECIADSLSNLQTAAYKKIARLYLVSDILHNCTAKVYNASNFRRSLECRLMQIFADVSLAYQALPSRIKAENFKMRVMAVFRAWEDWLIYPREFLIRLQNTFLGLACEPVMEPDPVVAPVEKKSPKTDPDLDGAPLDDNADDEDIDGMPLDGAALLKTAIKSLRRQDDDIDGVPLDDDLDGVPLDDTPSTTTTRGFVPSKWESVDPAKVQAEAITTSKWDLLENSQPKKLKQPQLEEDSSTPKQNSENDDLEADEDDSQDSSKNLETRRAVLRDIEVKVIAYQDELESGQRKVKSGWSIPQQVAHYRKKLTRKAHKGVKEEEDGPKKRRRSVSSNSGSRKSRKSRSASSSPQPPSSRRSGRSRSRSVTPIRKSSSRRHRSPSPASNHSSSSRRRSPLSPPHRHRSPYRERRSYRDRSRSRSRSRSPGRSRHRRSSRDRYRRRS